MFREQISMRKIDKPAGLESLVGLLGSGEGQRALSSAPLTSGEPAYWHAAARINKSGEKITEAVLFLKERGEEPRRLFAVETALIEGKLKDADELLDSVRDFLADDDDTQGSAAGRNFLAAWVCADAVGRCLKKPGS